MKVYVVKEIKSWRYLTETRDFINDLRQAELFFDYDCAKSFSPYGCEVVEVQIMETKDLADYTKQVKKKVCEEIRKFIHSGEYDNFGIEYLRTGLAVLEKLDQIQGETK